MNKKHFSIILVAFILAIAGGFIENTHADTIPTLSPFYYSQTSTITTRTTSTIVNIPELGPSSGDCVGILNPSGTLYGTACGSGSSAHASGTIDAASIFNATNTLVSVPILYVPSNFATAGCNGSSTLTDFGACVNSLYSSVAGTGVTIKATTNVTKAQWLTPINFNVNGLIPSLDCSAGVRLAYGGTGTAVTFNYGNPTGHLISTDQGCTYMGQSTLIAAAQTNTATTTGIFIGGTQGAPGINFQGNNVNGFGTNLKFGANTYLVTIQNDSFSGNNGGTAGQYNVYIPPGSNSGESMKFFNDSFTDPGNSSSSNCIYLDNGATADAQFVGGSADDCWFFLGFSNGGVNIDNMHLENAAFNTYKGSPYIYATSSGATSLNLSGDTFDNDATVASGSPAEFVEEAVNVYATGNFIDEYGTQTVNNFIDHTINPGQATEQACNNWAQNGAVNNYLPLSGIPSYPTCISEHENSYPTFVQVNGNSVDDVVNGQQNVETYDPSGNFTFGVGAGSTISVNNNLKVAGTAQFFGNVSTTIAANSFVATNGLGILIATTTPSGGGSSTLNGTANYNAIWLSPTSLGTDTIYTTPTTGDISLQTTTDCGWLCIGSSTVNLTISSTTGNVGIATTTPSSPLVVVGTSTLGGLLVYTDPNSSTVPIATFGTQNDTDYISVAGGRSEFGFNGNAVVQAGSAHAVQFDVNNATFGQGIAMTIATNTDVGIGTTTPSTALAVVGTSTVTGGGLGIGTSNPTVPLQVVGAVQATQYNLGSPALDTIGAAGADVFVRANTNGGVGFIPNAGATNSSSYAMYVSSSSFVGIGTTTPGNNLVVVGGTTVNPFEVYEQTSTPLFVGTNGVAYAGPTLALYSGVNSIATGVASMRGSGSGAITVNAAGTGAVYLNQDSGTGGVNFSNGAASTMGSVSSAGNVDFAGTAQFGSTAANTLPLHIVTASSSNALVVATSGNVGIGTSTPAFTLSVNGTTTAPCFSTNGTTCITGGGVSGTGTSQYNTIFTTPTTLGTDSIYTATSTGFIGIATTTPSSVFDVVGTSTSDGTHIINGYQNLMINPDPTLGYGVGTDTAVFGDRPNIGIPVPNVTPYQANQNIAFDIFPKGPTITNGFGSAIYGGAWQDICSSDLYNFATSSYECLHLGKAVNGFANVSTEQGGGGSLRPLVLQANGGNVLVGTSTSDNGSQLQVNGGATFLNNVGIGTAAPEYNLQVQTPGDSWAYGGMFMGPTNSNSGSQYQTLGGNGGLGFEFYGTGLNDSNGTAQELLGSNSTIQFQVGNGSVSPTTAMTISALRNVGIGTTTPSNSLVISGGLQLATASSSIITSSIGGAIVSGGCDSATSSISTSIPSSTTSFITTPQNDPGTTLGGTWAYSFISSPGVLTTRVCSNVSVTPNSTAYVVKIIQ